MEFLLIFVDLNILYSFLKQSKSKVINQGLLTLNFFEVKSILRNRTEQMEDARKTLWRYGRGKTASIYFDNVISNQAHGGPLYDSTCLA